MIPTFSTYRWNLALLWACCCAGATQPLDAAESLTLCSPDETHLATTAEQGRLEYRRASDSTVQSTFYICHPRAICFSQDGRQLAAAGGRNGSQAKIKVWRLNDRQQLCEIITAKEIHTLALSRDGRLVVGASSDGSLQAWRVSDGRLLWSRILSRAVESVRFSRDSNQVLVEVNNARERRFRAEDGRMVADAR